MKNIREQEMADVRALLRTREGARFLCRLLETCGVFRLSYTPGDTHATAFAEGQRNVGLQIYADIEDMGPIQEALKEREAVKQDGQDAGTFDGMVRHG